MFMIVIIEQMTLNASCHKHTYVMIMKVSCQSYAHTPLLCSGFVFVTERPITLFYVWPCVVCFSSLQLCKSLRPEIYLYNRRAAHKCEQWNSPALLSACVR